MVFWSNNTTVLVLLFSLSSICFSADKQDDNCNSESVHILEPTYGESVQILESAYRMAPKRVHRIVDSLLGKKEGVRRYPFNYTIFDGEPGVGKSTLALAIAYKLQWGVQKFGVNDFMKAANRNGTSVVFNNIMSRFEDHDKKTVIILEEINHLLMNYDSKHHDTDATSVSLWLFLDNIRNKSNLFFIGTTNGIGGFPPQLESRFKGSIITITAEKDINRIQEAILEGLSSEKITILDETRHYLDASTALFQEYNIRDIKHLIYEILGQADEFSEVNELDTQLVIRREHIDAAFQKLADEKKRFQAKPYREVEIEQRERHHREILEQSDKHFHETLAQNNRHFLISSVISIGSLIANLYFNGRNSFNALMTQRNLHDHAIDQQKDLYKKQLQDQEIAHRDALTKQEEAIQLQQSSHKEALELQQSLHDKALDQQVTAQEAAFQEQRSLQEKMIAAQEDMQNKAFLFQCLAALVSGKD